MNATAKGTKSRAAAPTRQEMINLARQGVKEMLLKSESFRALPSAQQQEIAKNTVDVVNYLIAPEGIPGTKLPTANQVVRRGSDPYAFPLAEGRRTRGGGTTDEEGKFTAQAAREGAEVAGMLLQQV